MPVGVSIETVGGLPPFLLLRQGEGITDSCWEQSGPPWFVRYTPLILCESQCCTVDGKTEERLQSDTLITCLSDGNQMFSFTIKPYLIFA